MSEREGGRRLGELICYSKFSHSIPTEHLLEALLLPYGCLDVLLRIAWLIQVSRTWLRVDTNEQDRRLRSYVFPKHADQLEGSRERVAFTRPSLLWLMAKALAICPMDGRSLESVDDLENVGWACLVANDLSDGYKGEKPLQVAASVLPTFEYFSRGEYRHDVVRTREMLASGVTSSTMVRDQVEKELGCPLEQLGDFVFAIGSRHPTEDVDPKSYNVPTISVQWLATTAFDKSLAASLFDKFSLSCEELKERSEGKPAWDLVALRNTPLLRLDDGQFIAIDPGFLVDKAGRGLFWATRTLVRDSKEGRAMLAEWGHAFEAYVNKILFNGNGYRERRVFRPRLKSNGAPDCCIVEGSTLIAIETKASVITSKARYGGDAELLRKELEKKFISGSDGERKGLAQLAEFVRRLASGEKVMDEGESGWALDATKITKVIPVVVHLDSALRTPGIATFLSLRFWEMKGPSWLTVTAPVTIEISQLEELEGYLENFDWKEVLESHLKDRHEDGIDSFDVNFVPILRGIERRPGPTLRKLEDMVESMRRRLSINEVS